MGTRLFKKGRLGAFCLTGKQGLVVVIVFVHLRETQTMRWFRLFCLVVLILSTRGQHNHGLVAIVLNVSVCVHMLLYSSKKENVNLY